MMSLEDDKVQSVAFFFVKLIQIVLVQSTTLKNNAEHKIKRMK